MTTAQMHTAIGLILDDTAEARWTTGIKDQALNAAQYKIIKSFPNDMLLELQTIETPITVSATGYVLSGLTPLMIPNGFCACKVILIGAVVPNIWTRHIWVDSMEFRGQNYYMKGGDSTPISYIFGGSLYVLLDTYTAANCSLYYIGTPPPMVDNGQASSLDITRHDLLVSAACAELLRWEGEIDQASIFDRQVGAEILLEIQNFQNEKSRRNREQS